MCVQPAGTLHRLRIMYAYIYIAMWIGAKFDLHVVVIGIECQNMTARGPKFRAAVGNIRPNVVDDTVGQHSESKYE